MMNLDYSKFISLMKEIAAQKGDSKALLFVEMHMSALSIATNAQKLWDLTDNETEAFYRELQGCIGSLHWDMNELENNETNETEEEK